MPGSGTLSLLISQLTLAASYGLCTTLNVDIEAIFHTGHAQFFCIHLNPQWSGTFRLVARARDPGDAGPVCVRAAYDDPDAPQKVLQLQACGAQVVELPLLSPSRVQSYVVNAWKEGLSGELSIAALHEAAPELAMLSTAVLVTPPRSPFLALPPPPPLPPHTTFCYPQKVMFSEDCTIDNKNLCPNAESEEAQIKCLDEHKSRISGQCLTAMRSLSECLYGPELLVPMEIASFLLLATASVVLLCTLLRCCCRYACVPNNTDDASETSGAAELEDITEDEEALVTPLPVGVKHSELPPQEPQDDALPSYNEVVDSAAIAAPSWRLNQGSPS